MSTRENIYADLLSFVKTDLNSNITDPLSSRGSDSAFVMTSFPHKFVKYPLITIRISNLIANRSGMQTDRLDIELGVEIRIWTKSQTQRDKLAQQIIDRLADIQFTGSGSVESDFHDFGILSSIDVDEPEIKIFSKVIEVQYRFFNA